MKHNAVPLPEDEHPFEAIMREAKEFARTLLEERERNGQLPWEEDPLFKDVPVYDGPVPADSSERYEDYLYGEDD
jgi:hypothetical protein